MNRTARVAIIGGGISGLAAAFHLQRLQGATEIVLVEARERLGGVIATRQVDGFTIEGGPDSFLASKPEGIELCEALGMDDQLITPDAGQRRSYVMHAGRLYPIPEGLSGLVPSRLEPLLESELFTAEGKRRLELEPELPAKTAGGDETLASFATRRFGREIYERLIEPLMGGIYAGNGEQLSLQATFPQLRAMELEKGSVLRGVRARQSRVLPAPRSGFLAPAGGMRQIVDALRLALSGVQIRTNARATGVRSRNGGYAVALEGGEPVECDALILAAPPKECANLLQSIYPRLAGTFSMIPTASTATVSLAYRACDLPAIPDGFGYIVPRAEWRPVLACTWASNKFPNRAPAGFALARAFLGRFGDDAVVGASDDTILDLARAELKETVGIEAQPVLQRIFRWRNAMPQYTLGHNERLESIESSLQDHPRLALAGNAYRGVGIPDC
ncbi:MAG: protoporphyrinogen oxidase, partial [Chloroflexota bacterium]